VTYLIRVAGIALAPTLLTACADGIVRLRYASDPTIERLASARALTVFRFADARGDEGDNDPLAWAASTTRTGHGCRGS
jgi:hypothetical protein